MNRLIKLESLSMIHDSEQVREKQQNKLEYIGKSLKPDDGDFHLMAKEMQLVSSN